MQEIEGGISTIELHEDLNNATFIVADVVSRVYFTDAIEDVTPIIIARNPSMFQFQSCVLQSISTVPEINIPTGEIVNPFSGNRRNINKYTSKNLVSEKVRPRHFSPQKTGAHCSFCYTNQSQVYDHMLKLKIGSRTMVVCPVLRKYVCPKCGATGDNAHTITYCPKTIREYGYKPDSVAKLLSKTSRNACGRPRPKDKKVCNQFQMSQ